MNSDQPLVCCNRRFGEGKLTELMEIMEESENEVDRRLTNPLREYLWWLSAVSAPSRAPSRYSMHRV